MQATMRICTPKCSLFQPAWPIVMEHWLRLKVACTHMRISQVLCCWNQLSLHPQLHFLADLSGLLLSLFPWPPSHPPSITHSSASQLTHSSSSSSSLPYVSLHHKQNELKVCFCSQHISAEHYVHTQTHSLNKDLICVFMQSQHLLFKPADHNQLQAIQLPSTCNTWYQEKSAQTSAEQCCDSNKHMPMTVCVCEPLC